MTRDELTEMIRSEIHSLAFETLRSNSKEKEDDKNRIFKPKGLSEEELEHTLFYGGNKPENESKRFTTTIREEYNNGIPQINSTEITQFEDSFEEMLKEIDGASVVFNPQSNGHSLKMSVSPQDGIEAGASGTIEMGNNGKLEWSYSLKSGLNIKVENLSIDKGNKLVLDKLYNHYDAWQKDWREKLTIEPGADEPAEDVAPEPSAEPEAAPAPEAGPGEEAPMPPIV